MKKYTIIVSRYQSTAVTIEADSIEMAEFIAEQDVDGGYFYDYDDMHEVIDSYEAEDQDDEASFVQTDNDVARFKLRNGTTQVSSF